MPDAGHDEDAATVIAVLTAIAGAVDDEPAETRRDVWGSPAHRLGVNAAGPHGWWASGQPS